MSNRGKAYGSTSGVLRSILLVILGITPSEQAYINSIGPKVLV